MIELSADLGEGSPREDEIWPLISAANVACGGHVGDEASMREAVRLARTHDVRLGAHPSYPDRQHFGRRTLEIGAEELRSALVAQIATLARIAREEGVRLRHVKAHGALYNDAHHSQELATILVEAMREVDPALALVAADRSAMSAAARGAGTEVIREAFADRRYEPDGKLMSRKEPRATLSVAEAIEQVDLLVGAGAVTTSDGSRLPLRFDTICVHADLEGAVERLRAIRTALAD